MIAQNSGRCVRGTAASTGSFVQPYTNPSSCSSRIGAVAKLMATVTPTHTSHDHKARYMFSAIPAAFGENAMIDNAAGSSLPQIHNPIDEVVPSNSPQNPPAGVARFHNIPRSTVPNSGAMKKLKSACT